MRSSHATRENHDLRVVDLVRVRRGHAGCRGRCRCLGCWATIIRSWRGGRLAANENTEGWGMAKLGVCGLGLAGAGLFVNGKFRLDS